VPYIVEMVKRIGSIAVLMLLAGCAVPDHAARVAQLNAMIGHNEADLIRAFGVPTRSIVSDGHKFLAYEARTIDIIPGTPAFGGWRGGWGWYYGGGFPPEVITRGCDTTFELSQDRVLAWTQRGDSC
jgi:hypothetical protein